MNYLSREVRLFFAALIFLTRIPSPVDIQYVENHLNKSAKYFPLIGILVGSISAITFWGAHFVFSLPIAILLSMAVSIWVTGAFHEDGFADVCDGFGGGWQKERILTIMKDSRVGAFGVIGVWLLLALKLGSLLDVQVNQLPYVMIAGHSISRLATISFLYTHRYVQEDRLSKVKPLAQRISWGELLIAACLGGLPLLWIGDIGYWILLFPVFTGKWILGKYFVKRIGGYTGDCLGAAQQITEIIFYLGSASQIQQWLANPLF